MSDYSVLVFDGAGLRKPNASTDSAVLTDTVKTAGSADLTFAPAGTNVIVGSGKVLQASALDTVTGGFTLGGTNASTIDVDGSGIVSINSSGAAINIGNDDIDQAVNVGTDGERAVTVGSVNGAASLAMRTGTGEMDLTSGGILDINATGAVTVDSASTATITAAGINLAGGSSEIDLTTTGAVDINSAAGTWDSSSTLAFEAATSGAFNVTTGALTLSTTTSGDLTLSTTTAGDILLSGAAEVDLTAAGLVDINAGANLDIDVTGTYDMLASGTFSIDGTGASNVTTASGDLTVSSGTGSVVVTAGEAAADAIQITASDASGGVDINAGGTSGVVTINGGGAATITTAGINLAAGSSEIDLTTTGVVDINSGGASSWTNDTGALTIQTTTSGTLLLDAVALLDINAGANMDVDVTGTIDIDGSSSITIGGTNATALTVGRTGQTVTLPGDLVVQGTTYTTHSENVNILDNHINLNSGYTTVSAQTGGFDVNYLPTTTADASDTGGFASTTTVVTVGTATFAAKDFVQVSGADNLANLGVYEVLSHVAELLTIKSSPVFAFCNNNFTVDATDVGAVLTKVNVALFQCKTDGVFETGKGADSDAMTASLADVASATLGWDDVLANDASSGAYNPSILTGQKLLGSAELTLEAVGGALNLGVNSGSTSINVGTDANAKTITLGNATGASSTVVNVGTGNLDLGVNAIAHEVRIGSATGAAGVTINTGTGGIDIGTNAVDATLQIGNATGANAMTLTTGTGALTFTAGGAFDANTAGATTITSAGINLAAGSSEIDLTTTGAVDINSAAGTWDSSSTLGFEAATSGSFNVTTGALTLSTTTSGDLTLSTTTAGDILLSGAAEIDLTAAGLIDVNAGANLDIDVTGTFDMLASSTFSIDGTGASNVTATSGNLTLATLTSGDINLSAVGVTNIDGGTGVTIDCPATYDIAITAASDNASDIIFTAHGSATNFNDTSNAALSGFTATTVIGALNELKSGGDSLTYTAGAGGITQYYATYLSADSTILHADADAIATSRFAGIAQTTESAAASVDVKASGNSNAIFDASLTLAAGEPVFISTTVGTMTNVAPSGSGDVVLRIGYISDTLTYNGTDDFTAEIQLQPGDPVTIG